MDKVNSYRKSPQALALNIAIVWCSLIFLLVLLNLTLTKILVILGSGGTGNRILLNLVVIVLFLSGTLYYLLTWDKQKIQIKSKDLLIKKSGTKKIYPFSSIGSVYLEQNWLGKMFNYGDIKINFLEEGKMLSLRSIEAPNKLIDDISRDN